MKSSDIIVNLMAGFPFFVTFQKFIFRLTFQNALTGRTCFVTS